MTAIRKFDELRGSSRAATTFGSRAFDFYRSLKAPRVPRGVHVMNPYAHERVCQYVRAFLDTFYADNAPRVLAFGINPGRFGAGLTGVTFTDPVALADECGVPNDMPRRRELSSIFVYDVIRRLGGPRAFYSRCFLTAAVPLGFTKRGLNYNYYDDPALRRAVTPFVVSSIRRQIEIGGRTDHAIVFGMGENYKFLERLNGEHGFFQHLHALEHPRFILQYRRKRVAEYLAKYEDVFARAIGAPTRRAAAGSS
jgi:hypothetical protein